MFKVLTKPIFLGVLVSPVPGGLGCHETIIPKGTVVKHVSGGFYRAVTGIHFERRLYSDGVKTSCFNRPYSGVFQVCNQEKLADVEVN